MLELTKEEMRLILELLSTIKVEPFHPDALATVQYIQSIKGKMEKAMKSKE